MSKRLLLFDLDGCLIDSTPAITGSIRHTLEALGVSPPAADSLRWCIGPPLHESFARLLAEPRVDAPRVREAVDIYRAHYATTSTRSTTVIPGIEAALTTLAAEATLAVVTSKPGEVARPLLDHLGLTAWFVAVHAPRADHQVEAKAVTLQRALDGLAGGDAARAVMIGDRSHDVAAGRACGTATVGVTWGAGDRGELEAAGADLIIDASDQLPAAVGRLP